jgi:hypothetical protein
VSLAGLIAFALGVVSGGALLARGDVPLGLLVLWSGLDVLVPSAQWEARLESALLGLAAGGLVVFAVAGILASREHSHGSRPVKLPPKSPRRD